MGVLFGFISMIGLSNSSAVSWFNVFSFSISPKEVDLSRVAQVAREAKVSDLSC